MSSRCQSNARRQDCKSPRPRQPDRQGAAPVEWQRNRPREADPIPPRPKEAVVEWRHAAVEFAATKGRLPFGGLSAKMFVRRSNEKANLPQYSS